MTLGERLGTISILGRPGVVSFKSLWYQPVVELWNIRFLMLNRAVSSPLSTEENPTTRVGGAWLLEMQAS